MGCTICSISTHKENYHNYYNYNDTITDTFLLGIEKVQLKSASDYEIFYTRSVYRNTL